jgi:hypothetical protein
MRLTKASALLSAAAMGLDQLHHRTAAAAAALYGQASGESISCEKVYDLCCSGGWAWTSCMCPSKQRKQQQHMRQASQMSTMMMLCAAGLLVLPTHTQIDGLRCHCDSLGLCFMRHRAHLLPGQSVRCSQCCAACRMKPACCLEKSCPTFTVYRAASNIRFERLRS